MARDKTLEDFSSADQFDLRDVIERFEELESSREDAGETAEALAQFDTSEDGEEFKTLQDFLGEVEGCGGDHQWRGAWYPCGFIRDSAFEAAMDELLEDIGDIPKNIPSYLKITVDYEALQMDYSSVELEGVTFWYR